MSYNNITISQWEQIQEYLKLPDAFTAQQEIYKIITNAEQSDINKLKVHDFFLLYNKATAFMLEEMPRVKIAPFKVDGRVFNPFLEYYDWEVWRLASISAAANQQSTNMALLIALGTFEKKGEQLTAGELKDRESLFRDKLSVSLCYSYVNFFLACYNKSMTIIQNYYPEVMEKMTLVTSGVGTYPLIEQQEVMTTS